VSLSNNCRAMSHGVQLSGNEMLNRKVLSSRRKVRSDETVRRETGRVLPCAVKAHRAVQSLQSERSFVRSRASSHVRPNKSRSFLIVKVHDTLGRPLFFLKSEGIQSIACRAILLESVRYTWPNHVSRRSLMTDSKVSCPVVSHTVLFVIMSFQLIFRIFLCHLCIGHTHGPRLCSIQ